MNGYYQFIKNKFMSSSLLLNENSKKTSTNPSENQKLNNFNNERLLNNQQDRQFSDIFSMNLRENSMRPERPSNSQTVTIIPNPQKSAQFKRRIESQISSSRERPTSVFSSNVEGRSEFFVQAREKQIIKVIQKKLNSINLKVGVNEGHEIPLEDNKDEIPLWLLCRGNYS